MNAEKQIEELGEEIFLHCSAGLFEDEANSIAEFVINKQGYRKASDVAEEIFERLHSHRKFDGHTVSVWLNDLVCIAKEYGIDLEGDAELKKKYTEGERNENNNGNT